MCIDAFFGLHIKSLINLKIVRTTFGIGGWQLPNCHLLATCLHMTCLRASLNVALEWYMTF